MANEDPERLELVRRMRCCAPGCSHMPCEAHHPRNGVGLSLRGHDSTAIPLCTQHHRDLHALSGPFKAWDGRTLRDWQQDMVEDTQDRVSILRARVEPLEIDEEDIPF